MRSMRGKITEGGGRGRNRGREIGKEYERYERKESEGGGRARNRGRERGKEYEKYEKNDIFKGSVKGRQQKVVTGKQRGENRKRE